MESEHSWRLGRRYCDHKRSFHEEFWKIAAEVGNIAIIGVDAHEPIAMETDRYRNEGLKCLQELGIHIIDKIEFKDFSEL